MNRIQLEWQSHGVRAGFYHALLRRFSGISHVTVEVQSPTVAPL